MKRFFYISLLSFFFTVAASVSAPAQCSICAKTTLQMGEKPAKGFNSGIIYLMLTPFAVVAFVGYKWWKANGDEKPGTV